MRYVLLVSYDGTDYGGWQIQNNAVTVQEKLTSALSETLGKKVSVTASGRTDSGVHASAQVCHFDAETSIPPEKFADALNFRLPDDISVLKSALAPEGFDAVRSAKKKTYCYRRTRFLGVLLGGFAGKDDGAHGLFDRSKNAKNGRYYRHRAVCNGQRFSVQYGAYACGHGFLLCFGQNYRRGYYALAKRGRPQFGRQNSAAQRAHPRKRGLRNPAVFTIISHSGFIFYIYG